MLATLDAMRPALRAIAGPWRVIGSAAMALHGIEGIAAGDIDIVLEVGDAAMLCGSHGFIPVTEAHSGLFRSEIHALRAGAALTIEIMAGPSIRSEGAMRAVRIGQPVIRDGWPVASLPDLIAMCRLFDRAKDRARPTLLEPAITP